MKKAILLIAIILTLFNIRLSGQTTVMELPKVDKRVELLSVVFRLAGKPEYCSEKFPLYTDRINNYFKGHKDHDLIKFTRSIMYKNGLGYDAVMSMAVNLDDNLDLRKNVVDGSLDPRWSENEKQRFVSLLKKFAADTRFDVFFSNNTELYAEAASRFLPIYKSIDIEWYTSFFGQGPAKTFILINGVGNGDHSYGPAVQCSDGRKEIYAIMGAWETDNKGMVVFRKDEYLPVIIHEFSHSFVNPLTERYKKLFEASAIRIFEVVKEQMQRMAYGQWTTMMNEALVRACVINYMQNHWTDNDTVMRQIDAEKARGFLWIGELVKELNNYQNQWKTYLTFEDYIPRLAEAYKSYARHIEAYDSSRPKVLSIDEFTNGDKGVNAAIKTITVNFDRPLSGDGYSISLGKKGKNAIPKTEKVTYGPDNLSIIMSISLEKGKEYQFILTGKRFQSVDGVGMKDYEVNFTTER